MGLWKGIFVILGCAVVGLILGIILIYIFQRIKKKQLFLFKREADFIKTEAPKAPVPTTSNDGIIKSDGQKEDALEILVKNHKNNKIVEKQEKPSQPDAINWTELIKPDNTPSIEEHKKFYETRAPQEPVTINQKNTLVVEEHEKPSPPSVPSRPEIANQKTSTVEEKQKKSTKSGALKQSEIINPNDTPIVREQKISPKPSAPQEPEIIKQKSTPAVEKQRESLKSDFIKELETNLAIATTPWADKLIPFQTSCWDAKHGESEPLLTVHHQDLIQLYVDIGLANNIVWLATEIDHRSKELDESYIKLCAGIAENLKRVVPSLNETIQ